MDINTMLGYVGCACAIGIPALGSSIGCGIAGAASHGVMAKVEEGHGKFIGMSAAPSSQTIYGVVLMFVLLGKINAAAGLALLGIGLFCGIGICISAIYQGKVAATGILASSKKPEVFGKCFAAVGIVESFALFAMVFGLIIATSIG
ncbi:ATP synthase subunit C [Desulfatiglans anilini]|uniref:ATP synthase subunit C n=1 Tax=Desulfatiglans anilini TaxID=90728 RepID=UPI000480071B|nr:ATP synthase subunit C [Desulfatiglans anilini]